MSTVDSSQEMGANRSRTVTWNDPSISAKVVREMSGLEFLQAIVSGKLPPPPIAQLLGFELAEVKPGRVTFTIEPAEYHYNPIGSVHGGVACTILDSVMSCAVQTMLPLGVAYTTLELKVNFVRAITSETGKMRGIGETLHVGRTIATAEGRLVDANDKLYGHATTTCLILAGG